MSLKHPDWNPRVKDALNDFLARNAYRPNAYACFDFDNTSSVFDVEEQLMIYQLETMAFAVDTDGLRRFLTADVDITPALSDMVEDIAAAYDVLYRQYGPFSASGVDARTEQALRDDPHWQEFATKMRVLYDDISAGWGSKTGMHGMGKRSAKSYAWELYWFSGMTPAEVYELAKRSHARYANVETYMRSFKSPASIESRAGVVSGSWVCGVAVPQNTMELWKALKENGIDIWIVSASAMEPIKAAVDYFGLHPYIRGVLAMTVKQDAFGKYIPAYDLYGVGELAQKDGTWQKAKLPTKAMTYRAGKVTAIENALMPLYNGYGPIAGFMDAVGDFYFCTVFESLELVLCFNRAQSPITDGAGLIAAIAKYSESPACPLNPRDTLYLLQGRDENHLRRLRPSDTTVRLGETEPLLFGDASCEEALQKWLAEKPTVEEIINQYFTAEFDGYHSHPEKK